MENLELRSVIERLTLATTARLSPKEFDQLIGDAIRALTRVRQAGTDLPNHGAITSACLAVLTADLHRTISMAEVAETVGVSQRTLQAHFRRDLGMPPHRYLHHLRLDMIRQQLLTRVDSTSIAQLAKAHGLRHPGRFAADYHTRFHEHPSQTRARTLAAALAATSHARIRDATSADA